MPYDATDFRAEILPAPVNPRDLKTPRERLIYLRDFLRELPSEKFDMGRWFGHECGTAVCIGGWTEGLFGERREVGSFFDEVGALIGLNREQSDQLFFPNCLTSSGRVAIELRDPQAAARVLDHLINTGKVDWSKA